MKWIKYEYVCGTDTDGAEILAKKRVGYSESNLAIAEAEAYNGEYTIEDDGTEVSNETKVPGDMNMQGLPISVSRLMIKMLLHLVKQGNLLHQQSQIKCS